MALLVQSLFVGFMYYLGAYIGVHFTSLESQKSLIWPPNAILLSALLMSQPKHKNCLVKRSQYTHNLFVSAM